MIIARLVPSTPERVEGLCPTCLLPALWRVGLVSITPEGVGGLTWSTIYCDSCQAESPTT